MHPEQVVPTVILLYLVFQLVLVPRLPIAWRVRLWALLAASGVGLTVSACRLFWPEALAFPRFTSLALLVGVVELLILQLTAPEAHG